MNSKQTFAKTIPKEWRLVKLGDIVEDILTGATPSRGKKEYWKNGSIPWLTNNEVSEEIINYIYDTKEKVTEKALRETNIKLIPPNSLILSLTASVGKVAINKVPITTNQQFNTLILKRSVIAEFLGYYLIFSKKRIEQLGGSTTFKFISKETIKSFLIPLPPLPEQKAIANILSTVDEAIQKVDEVIAKTERLKKGLMQKLLTRGIGHKEFKYSKELGCGIPKEWKVVKLGDVTEIVMGQSPPGNTYNEKGEGIPLINGPSEFGEKYPVKVKWTTNPTKTTIGNDVLICVRGHTTGRLNMSDGIYCIGRGVAAIRGLKNRISNFFIYYMLEKFQNKIFQQSYAAGSTFPNITYSGLQNIKIPLPPLPEQQKIAEILSTVDKKLELEKKRKEKLERIKKGLMNDLLTGRKRVRLSDWKT
ncbi:MAG: restriction endonuclease subunit S [Thermoplasmata archaeon]|nr:MAG: restriction endonuclease subunit S [Thermoplasmata archaeon]